MMCGGKSGDKEANEEIQLLLGGLKSDIQNKLGGIEIQELKALKYSTQVVAGTNYFIKAQIGNNKFIHVRAHKSLPHAGGLTTLHSIEVDKSESEPITYF